MLTGSLKEVFITARHIKFCYCCGKPYVIVTRTHFVLPVETVQNGIRQTKTTKIPTLLPVAIKLTCGYIKL